jgi:hypothetical protein
MKSYKNYRLTEDGEVLRVRTSGELVPAKVTELQYGHKVVTIGGEVVYVSRLMWCLFSGIDYSRFSGKIRYKDGNPRNVAFENLYEKPELKPMKEEPVWLVRKAYASGMSHEKAAEIYGLPLSRVRTLCIGFDQKEKFNIF